MTSFHSCEREREKWSLGQPCAVWVRHEWFDATPVGCPDRWGDRRLLPISSHRCLEASVWQVSGNIITLPPPNPSTGTNTFSFVLPPQRCHTSILQAALPEHYQGHRCELIVHDLISQLREIKREVEFGTTLCSMGMSMNGLMLE